MNTILDLKATISPMFDQLLNLIDNDDYEAIADLFTDDAVILHQVLGMVEGREAIINYYKAAKEQFGDSSMSLEILKIEQQGDLINVVSTY